jgi:hypothetical protein
MTIKMDMINCSNCGQCHPVSRGCNANDVNKYHKEREKWMTKGCSNNKGEVTQKDIDDILSGNYNEDKLFINSKMPIEEWGELTGLKQALEIHKEYGDDIVRLSLITFRQFLQENLKGEK